ncbi:MAG: family 10 glycosylhydrolase [Anaerolineales bacterium]|nr:family 10 glycosylhydrolase [Anaerolineales bacterium]
MLRETRALWTWAVRSARSKSDIDELVALVDSAHLNVILFGVYYRGTAYFEPSPVRFPIAAERLTNQSRFSEAGYADALRYLLDVRDRRRADSDPANDFEVHAWFTVHLSGDSERTWPPTDLTQPYMLNALFPEFQVKYGTYYARQDERFVNPAISAIEQPRFRQYMADLIAGAAEDYAIDGVHLDYIRVGQICFNAELLDYPGIEFDYAGCQEDYRAFTRETFGREYTLWDDTDGVRQIADGGSGRVAAWQVRTVGRLVRAIHAEVKAVRPDLIISVASVRNVPWELPVQGQAAWRWLDAGWIDAIFPTLYLDSTPAIVDRMQRLREAVRDTSKRDMIFAGLATHSFVDRTEDWSGLVVERVNAVVRGEPNALALQPAAHGVALFGGEYFSQTTIEALAAGPFREPAIPYWGTPIP